jgi:hypothetical protein
MRNRQLHAALAAFAEEAASQLAFDTASGAEVPFEVVELTGGRRESPLYCYRPLTASFIDERRSILARLASHLPAVHALAACGGLDAYLVARGDARVSAEPRARAEEALRHFLTRVFEDAGDFELSRERLARAYEELESMVMEGRALTEVVAPVLGLALVSDEVALGDGLTLVRADTCEDAPADAVRERADGRAVVLARLTWEAAPGDEAPLRHAQVRLRRLLTALRLYDAAGIVLARTAWTRTGAGAWQPFALAGGAAPRGTCVIPAQQEDELRAFLSLVGRRTPRSGELAWALHRFELANARAIHGAAARPDGRPAALGEPVGASSALMHHAAHSRRRLPAPRAGPVRAGALARGAPACRGRSRTVADGAGRRSGGAAGDRPRPAAGVAGRPDRRGGRDGARAGGLPRRAARLALTLAPRASLPQQGLRPCRRPGLRPCRTRAT